MLLPVTGLGQHNLYAVGAFNAENMEMVKAIVAAAEELKAPVMIQTTPSTINYGTLETYTALVHAEAKNASVPVALHLDHGVPIATAREDIPVRSTNSAAGAGSVFVSELVMDRRKVCGCDGRA